MPNLKSVKKSLRSSRSKRVFNLKRNRAMKDVVKEIRRLTDSGKKKEAEEMLPKTYKALDKAAKRGVIKKNTASRQKSRLTKKISSLK